MPETYDAIYLSPHLDDVALSCGGQIAARARGGEAVLVFTLFTGDEPASGTSNLAATLHGLFGLEDRVVAHRRQEDLEACKLLGAQARHADLPDALYRVDPKTGTPLYPRLARLFGQPLAADRAVLESLSRLLAELPRGATVFAPLGVGQHVDHLLVRSAAELAIEEISYYEETPYADKRRPIGRALARRADWDAIITTFDEVDLDAKIAACSAYKSQIKGLYRTPQRLERALRRRAQKLGGERLWKRRRRSAG